MRTLYIFSFLALGLLLSSPFAFAASAADTQATDSGKDINKDLNPPPIGYTNALPDTTAGSIPAKADENGAVKAPATPLSKDTGFNNRGKDGNILSNQQINNLGDFNKANLLEQEVQKLNAELDDLNNKLQSLQDENQQLKINLQKYSGDAAKTETMQAEIEALSNEARDSRGDLDNNSPSLYMSALNLLIVKTVDSAKEQLKEFLDSVADQSSSTVEDTGAASRYLGNEQSTNNKYIAYANYWLGRINEIQGNYKDAVSYYSESYKLENYTKLSLLSLIGLIKSLSMLGNTGNACSATAEFEEDYKKTLDSGVNLDKLDLDIVNKLKSINQCS